MLTRRQLIAHAGAIAGGTVAFACSRDTARADGTVFIGCRGGEGGGYRLSGIGADGRTRFDMPLPGRGHDVTFHPTRPEAIVFARRPGTFAIRFDCRDGTRLGEIRAAEGRHFYGHGVFAADGHILVTTENEFATGDGRLGIRDPRDGYRQIGELPSHGIGPHDVMLMPDERTLAVANGGIRTHPDRDREKLNIADMKPNLALIELASGRLVARFELPATLHQLSIRHLDVAADGRIAIAMQYEGGKGDAVPLIALCDGNGLRCFDESAGLARAWRHYTGSIAFDTTGRVLGVTAPRGNIVSFWDCDSGHLLTSARAADVAGIAAARDGFLTTGQKIDSWSAGATASKAWPVESALHTWDNHLAGGSA
ncbi:MAG: DUF1513 domain-containing protein [Geminicoccaceae bacterium]|nr:DUF1513 domain-containing protein [Geminicoccaceae bacterium]